MNFYFTQEVGVMVESQQENSSLLLAADYQGVRFVAELTYSHMKPHTLVGDC